MWQASVKQPNSSMFSADAAEGETSDQSCENALTFVTCGEVMNCEGDKQMDAIQFPGPKWAPKSGFLSSFGQVASSSRC